jgi:hypothetical protein
MGTAADQRRSIALSNDGYRLEGQEVEACDCMTLCPCVLGDDPTHGGCVGILARRITKGEIRGVDVSGLTWLEVFESPGNMLKGNIRKLVYVDRDASIEQLEALCDAFQGRLGGPLKELAELDGERVGVYQTDIECEVREGDGRVAATGKLRAVMTARRGQDGTPTKLLDSQFSTIAGEPAWLAKASELTVVVPEHGFQFTFAGRSAIEGAFRFAT